MKLCFSTVGCPNWTWNEITSCAVDLGYQGIEVRGLGEDLFVPELRIFQPGHITHTCEELAKKGLSISCLASDVLLHLPDFEAEPALDSYVDLAAALNVPYIRVLGDSWGAPGENVDSDLVLSRLKSVAPAAEKANVTLLVETNGIWADTARLKHLIEDVGSPFVRVLWDVSHPVRYFDESADTTFANIGQYVKHVHLKDSVAPGKLKMLGYGDLPLKDILKKLKDSGYGGFLSLEWTKRWNDELEDAGIVFAHFVYQVKKLLQSV